MHTDGLSQLLILRSQLVHQVFELRGYADTYRPIRRQHRSGWFAIGLMWLASVLLPDALPCQNEADRNRWELGLVAATVLPGGEPFAQLGLGVGTAVSGSYRTASGWGLRGDVGVSTHVCSEPADAIPFYPSSDVGCTYLLARLGPVFRHPAAAALFSPSVGLQFEFVNDLSTDGFGFGGAVTGGLSFGASHDVGIYTDVSGALVRFRRIYRYWDTGTGWSETATWQWGRVFSLSLGARLAMD